MKETSSSPSYREHAVVIGGSIAGLLAARVLADHFARVTVVERDQFPSVPQTRKFASQARHAHILLAKGQQLFEQLFAGIGAELAHAGAPEVDAGADIAWFTPAGWALRFRSGLNMISPSRDLLEWAVRRRVAALSSVTFLTGTDVDGLVTTPDSRRAVGILTRPHDASGPATRLMADLVVDASGRTSKAPLWLSQLGYDAPQETVVESRLSYSSRIYRAPEHSFDWKALYAQAKPPEQKRSGLVLPIEGGRWLVTLAGRGGEQPPSDEAGFLDYARSVPCQALGEAVAMAEPLGAIAVFRATNNRWRHFERLVRQPEGFVVLGDAACAFNPVYGQGMTTAALGAVQLGECLRGPTDRLARRFQSALAGLNATPWLLATGEDNRYNAAGPRPSWSVRLKQRYVDEVVRLGTQDANARLRLLRVLHLLESPTSLFRPSLSLRVLGRSLRACGQRGE